ncbi:MAG: hypothetical protein E6G27_09160 [Actinobacteria bacterium]|nr:MAG: hypothetical protein E6G27_09160 [Actinomycetota bacterium]
MIAVAADTFSHSHIALTAGTTGLICAGVALWLLDGERRILAGIALGVIAGSAVYLWRASANMPQLNNDGLQGYSANDWLAPVVTFVALSVYRDLIPLGNPKRFAQVRAIATIVAFAVNVITI